MCTKTNSNKIGNLIADIEGQLRRIPGRKLPEILYNTPTFKKEFEEVFLKLQKENNQELQNYVEELLEKSGPKRRSGKIDTKRFYESICISAATWSNFTSGKFSPETIRKIIAGLECNMEQSERVLRLAGLCLTNSRRDNLIKAAILSGHHNTQDMYEILEYYSKQYPKEVKNYYKDNKS